MFNLSKSNVAFTALILGLPVALLFQNCGQAGSIMKTGGSSEIAPNNSISTSDTMVIIQPAVDAGLVSDVSSSSGSVRSNPDHNIHLDDPSVSTDDIKSEKGSTGQCGNLLISDILLSVASISMHGDKPNDASFEIIDSDKFISLNKLNLKIKALKSDDIKEMFMLLNADGNKVLSNTNEAMELKTPSAQQSGLKVQLIEMVTIESGKSYNLELTINPDEQIVTNKTKCLFKPVVRGAKLSEI